MNRTEQLWQGFRRFLGRAWAVLWRALTKYDETDGEQRAASFAYYAFFALFPLILLLINIATLFLKDQDATQATIGYVKRWIPVQPEEAKVVINTIDSLVKARGSSTLISFAVLGWSALRFFQALVRGVNRAW